MNTVKRWPAYRRKLAPPGVCIYCWKRGGPPVPAGELFKWGYPSLHPGEGPAHSCCAACQTECREMGIELIPVPRLQLMP